MRTETKHTAAVYALALSALLLLATACRQDMHDQAKYEPLEASSFYANGMASRPLIANTVPRGFLREDTVLFTGLDAAGSPAAIYPQASLAERIPGAGEMSEKELWGLLLKRGETRYGMFCTPCHDPVGTGRGMIVQRGFKSPPSLHEERLRESPPGYFVNVMTEGFGQMSSYAPLVSPEDRWAIAAYIQALQLSQHVRLAELPAELVHSFGEAQNEAPADAAEHGSEGHGEEVSHGADQSGEI